METVNENSTHVVTAVFKTPDGELVVPSAGTWRVDDVSTGEIIIPETDFTPIGSRHDFKIPYDKNTIITAGRYQEAKKLTVSFVYTSGRGTGEYEYLVQNLDYVA